MPTRKPTPAETGDDPVYEPRIHPKIRDRAVPVDSLHEFYKNPNEGDEEIVAKSLKRNGQYKAITVNLGTLTGRPDEILCGNTTYRAAKLLEWPDIAVDFVDVGEHAARRIVATDNESAKKGRTNNAVLLDLLDPIKNDLEGSSISADEFAKMAGVDGPAADESGLLDDQKFAVIINCRDEDHQRELLEAFESEGLDAKALVQ